MMICLVLITAVLFGLKQKIGSEEGTPADAEDRN